MADKSPTPATSPDSRTPKNTFAHGASLALAAILLVADQASKLAVRKHMVVEQDRITIIPNFLDFVHVQNHGAAWGIMQNQTLFLSVVSVVMLLLVLIFRRHIFENTITHYIVYGLLISGIIGNLIDRLKQGHVTDFIDAHLGDGFHWPVFNIADSCICIAVGIYLWTTWRKPAPPPHPTEEKT